MVTSKRLRLAKLIDRETRELHASGEDRGYNALSRRIRAANPSDRHWRVDWKKLKAIAKHDGYTKLTINQWIALDRYFSSRGESFSETPLFERNILEPVGDIGRVCFALGSVPSKEEKRNNVRAWDCRSMALFLQEISKLGKHVDFEIHDILLKEKFKPERLETESWYGGIHHPTASVIAIGSPRICVATELLLARMFNIPPFTKPTPGTAVPFYFIWAQDYDAPYQSSFTLSANDIAKDSPKIAQNVRQGISEAFKINNKVFEVARSGNQFETPAAIVVQRLKTRNVLLVVAGISGPSTFGAAKFLAAEVTDSLPLSQNKDHDGPVLWATIMVKVRATGEPHKDDRIEEGARWLTRLAEWKPA